MDSSNGKHNGSGNGHDPEEEEQGDDDNVIRIPTLAERDKMRREQEEQWRKEHKKQHHEPLINLPPLTKIMLLAFLVIHAAITFLLDSPQEYWVFEHFGFKPEYYTRAFPGWPAFAGPFTYMFLHGGWLHVCMNTVMMMAFGAGVEKWMGSKRMFILFYATSLAAALIHFAISPFSEHTMIGASGGISGLFAAVLIMLQMQGRLGAGKHGILPFAALWIGISIVFGLLGGPGGGSVAWAAHIGGFLAGLILIRPILRIK